MDRTRSGGITASYGTLTQGADVLSSWLVWPALASGLAIPPRASISPSWLQMPESQVKRRSYYSTESMLHLASWLLYSGRDFRTASEEGLCFWGVWEQLSCYSKYAYTHEENHSAANATIAIIYLFSIVASGSLGTLSPVYIPECLETNSRAKGKSLALLVVSACSAIITYSSGPAFEHLKYYFYLVFGTWDIFEFIVIFLFFPETKGRTLEELEEVFSSKNPVKKSLEKRSAQTVLNTLEVSDKAADLA